MNRLEAWRAILNARTDVDRIVAAAVGDYPDRPPVRPSRVESTAPPVQRQVVPFRTPTWNDPGTEPHPSPYAYGPDVTEVRAAPARSSTALTEDERDVLRALRGRVEERVDALQHELRDQPGSEQAMTALVLDFDERIMARLPEYLRLRWPLLQTARTRSATGGDDFYRFADELRANPRTPSFVLEVYYFCLAHGFVGRYADDLASIERYKHVLREAIEIPRTDASGGGLTLPLERVASPIPAWLAYAIALTGVVLVTAIMTVLSNSLD